MQTVPLKVSNALQRIYHEIDNQLIFMKQDLAVNVLSVTCLTFCMLGLHTLSAYWR